MSEKSTLQKLESKIQQDCVMWYRNTYCLTHHTPRCMVFSIPNEGRQDRAASLIQTGLYPGCADIQIIHTRSIYRDAYDLNVLFIEFKKPGGKQSDNQKKFQAHCRDIRIPYHVIDTFEEFKELIENL